MPGVLSKPGDVWTITLDNPPANTWGWEQLEGVSSALDEAEQSSAHVVVFRSGGRFFSTGVDISLIERVATTSDTTEIGEFGRALQSRFRRIEGLTAPTVALIQGHALGGGLEFALACDLRIAEESARMGLPEAKLGLLPGAGGTQRLTREAGRGTALRLILTGELVSARWAEQHGLVQFCLPDGQGDTGCHELVESLTAIPRGSLAASKRSIALAYSDEGFATEIEQTQELLRAPETVSRLNAFLNRSNKK